MTDESFGLITESFALSLEGCRQSHHDPYLRLDIQAPFCKSRIPGGWAASITKTRENDEQ